MGAECAKKYVKNNINYKFENDFFKQGCSKISWFLLNVELFWILTFSKWNLNRGNSISRKIMCEFFKQSLTSLNYVVKLPSQDHLLYYIIIN